MMAGVLVAALPAAADTNLFDNGTWSLIGIEGINPEAHQIAVIVDKEPAGSYSDLVLRFNFDELGPTPTCQMSGEGAIRMLLPEPSVPGGAFRLSSYWDCTAGLVRPVAITELSFQTKGNAKSPLKVAGKLSNFDSLESKNLKMQFSPADTNRVQVELRYQLRATRDICVDLSKHDEQDDFRIVSMGANYISAESNQNDLVRYVRVTDKNCDPYSGCHVRHESFCANLLNESGYLFGTPRRLGDRTVALFHTLRVPVETPTLAVDFRHPSPHATKPQAFITPVLDGAVDNIQVWGNWLNVKKEYRSRRNLGNFRVVLYTRDPYTPNCDQTKEPPAP